MYEVTNEGIIMKEEQVVITTEGEETIIISNMVMPKETFIEAYEKYIVQDLLRKKLT